MTLYYKPIVINGVLYETQWTHDARIAREARQLKRAKVLSRSRAGAPGRRAHLIKRAKGACEICRVPFPSILNIHHIYPVRLGGAASDRNLVAICPNCHASVHYVSKSKHPDVVARKVQRLRDAGYTVMQAELIKLIASHDAHVLDGGTIEPYTDPPEQPFVIIDAPDIDPEIRKVFEEVYDARQERSRLRAFNSPMARILREDKADSEARMLAKAQAQASTT